MDWKLCDNPGIFLDVSHWQGVGIDFAKCKELGVRGVIAKQFHGKASVDAYEEQINGASAAGIEFLGSYGWDVPAVAAELQADAWTPPPRSHLPFTIDWEDPSTQLRGKNLIAQGERLIELVSDKHGRRPILYTGAWYWQGYCQNVDSEIFASCDLWLAAYPRKSATGVRYVDAALEVCGGVAPAVPLPWARRGKQPIGLQFSGDPYKLYLPPSKNGATPVVDVSAFDIARVQALMDLPPDTLPETGTSKRRSSERAAFINAANPIMSVREDKPYDPEK